MNRERINKWIQELKSTDKPQIKGFLQIVDKAGIRPGFCCVGIACDLAVCDGLEIQVVTEFGKVCYDGNTKTEPPQVRDYYDVPPQFFQLGMTLNDANVYSFKRIADVYEFLMNTYYKEDPNWENIPAVQDLLDMYVNSLEKDNVK